MGGGHLIVEDKAKTLQTTCNDYSRADGFNMVAYETHPADSWVTEMGETCQTVTSRWGTGGGNVPLVQQAFRKSRRAQSTEDYETWVDDGKANTLNTFDLGDIRTTHAIALQGAGSTSQNVNGTGYKEEQSFTLNTTDVHGVAYGFEPGIAKREGEPNRFVEEQSPTLRANMGDNQTAVAHAFKIRGGGGDDGKGYLGSDETAFTLSTNQDQHIAIGFDSYNNSVTGNVTKTLDTGSDYHHVPNVYQNMAVRRLTPIECERLQGFPDNYTDIKPKGKDTPDGPRYKALGNSMAVPVMKWIGERIQMVENLKKEKA